MAHFCAAATGPPGRSAWGIIPPPLTPPVRAGIEAVFLLATAVHHCSSSRATTTSTRNGRLNTSPSAVARVSAFVAPDGKDLKDLRALGRQAVTARMGSRLVQSSGTRRSPRPLEFSRLRPHMIWCPRSSAERAPLSQGEGRGFESRRDFEALLVRQGLIPFLGSSAPSRPERSLYEPCAERHRVRDRARHAKAQGIRLLMLAGCPKSEIHTLRWSDVDLATGEFHLADANTGPRGAAAASRRTASGGVAEPQGQPLGVSGQRPGRLDRRGQPRPVSGRPSAAARGWRTCGCTTSATLVHQSVIVLPPESS